MKTEVNIIHNRIARVFPRKTNVTPDDELAFIACAPPRNIQDISAVHISVAFTYDIPRAMRLERRWRVLGVPVQIGGPAFDAPGGEFMPGMYVKNGYVITSRGCPNSCWFCSVPKREGPLRELQIHDGWNIMDDNLLACSDGHILSVFEMLKRQEKRPVLSGGLEAARLKSWHVDLIRKTKVQRMYFAYDTPDDYEPLLQAGKLLREGGITVASHRACCYVLIGYKGDTFEKAEHRLNQTIQAGFMPYAMLYRDRNGIYEPDWRRFQRQWVRPQFVGVRMKSVPLILP